MGKDDKVILEGKNFCMFLFCCTVVCSYHHPKHNLHQSALPLVVPRCNHWSLWSRRAETDEKKPYFIGITLAQANTKWSIVQLYYRPINLLPLPSCISQGSLYQYNSCARFRSGSTLAVAWTEESILTEVSYHIVVDPFSMLSSPHQICILFYVLFRSMKHFHSPHGLSRR